jgi:hypothetical protein
MRRFRRWLRWLWASPYTGLGVALGLLGVATGGGFAIRRGALEFHGGAVRWLLSRFPLEGGAIALTLGHAILGVDREALDLAREHEHVHVRQFERWGPLMGPAYVGASLWLWLQCRRPYRDNPFEREAYAHDTPMRPERRPDD